ncbi:hypothetical protein C5S53_07510 [Methanophagales archaeon]|nr:hypothetical protein C5S53_07510 [Methanophagales archaeon]
MVNSVKTNIKCGKCGKPISDAVYEFGGVKLCEDCYLDDVIASQPRKCVMK